MEARDLAKNPLEQFQHWLREAEVESGLEFPNAMALATVGKNGRPSVRMVLLKGVNKNGFVFFTNYQSRKGKDLSANSQAALCFYWEKLGIQVRVEGKARKIPKKESTDYFHTRPRGSQIGAWASPQSRELESRAQLEERVKELQARFQDEKSIPLPPDWGGFRLVPDRIEFWKNGLNRLHDRFEYVRSGTKWKVRRLAP